MSPAIAEHEENVIRKNSMSSTNESPESLLNRFIELIDNHKDYTYQVGEGSLYLIDDETNIAYSIDLYENLFGDVRYENLLPQLSYCVENILNWEEV